MGILLKVFKTIFFVNQQTKCKHIFKEHCYDMTFKKKVLKS